MKAYYGRRMAAAGRSVNVWERGVDNRQCNRKLDIEPSRKLNDHSTEFNWGYSGSGPAQLSLAILLDMWGDPHMALSHYQQFKEDKVANFGGEWKITGTQIDEWLANECGMKGEV